MVMLNTSPIHIGVPKSWAYAIPATANTARDGTGTITDVTPAAVALTASQTSRIKIVATGTTTAGMVRIFGHDGTAYRLLHELSVAAVTPSGTVKAAIAGAADGVLSADGYLTLEAPFGGTIAGNIQKIGVSTHNAEAFACHHIGGGDFQ